MRSELPATDRVKRFAIELPVYAAHLGHASIPVRHVYINSGFRRLITQLPPSSSISSSIQQQLDRIRNSQAIANTARDNTHLMINLGYVYRRTCHSARLSRQRWYQPVSHDSSGSETSCIPIPPEIALY